MSDSIRVNNDVKLLTRYALGLTPEEEREATFVPGAVPLTIGLEKGIRGAVSIFPDLKNPKMALQEQKMIEQGLKGTNFNETYSNFMRNMDIQALEKRFRPYTGNPAQDIQKLQQVQNIKRLAAEAKQLTGAAKTQKLKELQRAFSDFQQANGLTKGEAKKFLTDMTDKKLAKEMKKAQKAMQEFNKSKYYDDVRRLIGEAKTLKGKDYTNKMKEIEKAIADANQKVHIERTTGSLKPLTKRGKVWSGIKKYTGYNVAKSGINTALTKSQTARTIAKFGRANALTAVGIDVALSVGDIIETKNTFDHVDENGNTVRPGEGTGTQKALKETARVVTTAGVQVGAYAIGAKAGAAAVAMLWASKGAALGSVVPGGGTAIGAIVGFGVGLLSCWFAGKAMEKAIGKSELDKLKDNIQNKPAEQTALAAQQDDAALEEVLLAAKARYENDPRENKKIEKAYSNVVTAYQNNEIGSAVSARQLSKPEAGQDESASNQSGQGTSATEQQDKSEAALSAKPKSAASKTQTSSQQQSTDTSKTKTDSKETDNSEKYKETIKKLDYVLNMLNNMYSSNNSAGMYSMYNNPMMFNNPFSMTQFGMYS